MDNAPRIFTAPRILTETRNGVASHSLEDEMLKNRQVCLMGPVDEDSVNSLITQLLYLEQDSPGEKITFYINSGGGEVRNGLALYDVMQYITSPVHTVCIGLAASMAAVLFASGDHRELFTHSKVMIHDPSISGSLTKKALELQVMTEDLMDTRQALAEILARHTGQNLQTILEKTVSDTYFDAQDAVDFGLADDIIA